MPAVGRGELSVYRPFYESDRYLGVTGSCNMKQSYL